MKIITNLDLYLKIAEEAYTEMHSLDAMTRTPKSDESPGFVVKFDYEQKSFKQALIAIAFLGMYFEALVFVTAMKRFGREAALKIDRKLYEDRLVEMGINDPVLLAKAKEFRNIRKDLVHEKAIELSDVGSAPLHFAQHAATDILSFIMQIKSLLGEAP